MGRPGLSPRARRCRHACPKRVFEPPSVSTTPPCYLSDSTLRPVRNRPVSDTTAQGSAERDDAHPRRPGDVQSARVRPAVDRLDDITRPGHTITPCGVEFRSE